MYICVFDEYKSLDFLPFVARNIEEAKTVMVDQIREQGKFIEVTYNGGLNIEDRFILEFKTNDGEIYELDGWKQ